MAKAVTITVDSAFDSSLPVSLHSLGASGYINRYVADTIPGAAGSTVALWQDLVSTLNLPSTSLDRQPTLGVTAGHKYISFNGTSQSLSANFKAGGVKTVALVARNNNAASEASYYMFNGDVLIARPANSNAGLLVTGGGTVTTPIGSAPAGKWGIIIAVVDGGNSIIRANGLASPNSPSTATGEMSRFTLGRESNIYAKIDIAELVAWPRALSEAECAVVLSSLQTNYASMLTNYASPL